MSAAIPETKRNELIALLRTWLHRSYGLLTELQSLIGSLMWVAQVALHGRTFIQALINRTKNKSKSSGKIKINRQCKDDIKWWLELLPSWRGLRLLEEVEWRNGSVENLYTDASDWGGGATFREQYIIFPWRADIELKQYSIQVREFFCSVGSGA